MNETFSIADRLKILLQRVYSLVRSRKLVLLIRRTQLRKKLLESRHKSVSNLQHCHHMCYKFISILVFLLRQLIYSEVAFAKYIPKKQDNKN